MKEILGARIEKIVRAAILTGLILAAFGTEGGAGKAEAATPNSNQNPYPYAKSAYWAWQNRPDLPPDLGLPKNWDDNAARLGWPVSGYPRKGDIAVFEPGIYDADPVEGHVAVVEQVFDNGTYSTSQMDEADCHYSASTCGQVNKRLYPIVAGTSFIHYKKDIRTTWGFASGAAGWTAKDMGAGNMGGPGWYYPLAGNDPQLVSPELDIPLDSYNAIEVDAVVGLPVADPTMQVFFATDRKPDFTASNSVQVEAQADGVLHRYTFYLGSKPDWSGKLTRLRLDPAGSGAKGGVRIDRVGLVRTDTAETYTTLAVQAGGGRSRP